MTQKREQHFEGKWHSFRPSQLDEEAMAKAEQHLSQLTKPVGSLGKLEELSIRLAGITADVSPTFSDKRIVIMAADHGVANEGVSAYPPEVTQQMVRNFVSGGAAINVIARQFGAQVIIVDVGVNGDLSDLSSCINRKIAYGTENMLHKQAMTREQVEQAIQVGIDMAKAQIDDGATLLAGGEMGIGNTTASAAIVSVLTSTSVDVVAGKGTGVTEERLLRKKQLLQEVLRFHQPDPSDPLDVLQKVGGLEIAALAGLMIGSASARVPLVVDGFIASAAALCAEGLCPGVRRYLIASHLSEEPGHRIALNALELEPFLHMNMRLGEGSGAVLLFPIIDSAQRIMREMATFEQAGVSREAGGNHHEDD